MSLYPTTVIDGTTLALDPNRILPGNLIVSPVDMTVTQMLQITLQQMANTQDFSLRTWVSLYPDGIAFAPGNIPILKWANVPIVIYVPSQIIPEDTIGILVQPGKYFLNILNLTNEHNVFGYSQTVLA